MEENKGIERKKEDEKEYEFLKKGKLVNTEKLKKKFG